MKAAELQQRRAAIGEANRIRIGRADLKKAIAKDGYLAADVLLNPPDYAATMKVADVLAAQYHWGQGKVWKLLWRNTVNPTALLCELSTAQAHLLARDVRDWHDGRG